MNSFFFPSFLSFKLNIYPFPTFSIDNTKTMDKSLKSKVFFVSCTYSLENIAQSSEDEDEYDMLSVLKNIQKTLDVKFSDDCSTIAYVTELNKFWQMLATTYMTNFARNNLDDLLNFIDEAKIPLPNLSFFLSNIILYSNKWIPHKFLDFVFQKYGMKNVLNQTKGFFLDKIITNERFDIMTMYLVHCKPDQSEIANAFVSACRDGLILFAKSLFYYLENYNVDVRCGQYGSTPLMHAAQCCHIDTVMWLLNEGANPLCENKSHTARWYAQNELVSDDKKKTNQKNVIKLLFQAEYDEKRKEKNEAHVEEKSEPMEEKKKDEAVEEAPAAEKKKEEAPVEKKEEAPVEKKEEAPVEKKEEAPVEKNEEAPVEKNEEAPVEKKEEAPVEEKEEAPAAEKKKEEARVEKKEEAPVEKKEEAPVEEKEEAPVEKKEEDSNSIEFAVRGILENNDLSVQKKRDLLRLYFTDE